MSKKVLTFSLFALSAIALFFDNLSASTPKKCEINRKIVFGALDWQSNTFHTEIMRLFLEEGYGCETDAIPGTTLPLIAALSRGDIDVLMEVWIDNVGEAWGKPASQDRVALNGLSIPDAEQGFYVPTYMIKGDGLRGIHPVAPDLKRVSDIVKYADLFTDPEDPTRGRFYNCVIGWACETINNKKLIAYDLQDKFSNFRPGTGGSLAAAIASHYERGTPFFAYYWGPTWIMGKYDLTKLEEPPFDPVIWNELKTIDRPTRATNYPVTRIHIGINQDFSKQAPGIAKFISRYRASNRIVSDALGYMAKVEGRTPRDAAFYFLRTREDIWSDFVPAEMKSDIRQVAQAYLEKQRDDSTFKFDEFVNHFVQILVHDHQDFFDSIGSPIRTMIMSFETFLMWLPTWLFIAIFLLFSYWISQGFLLPLTVGLCFGLIGLLGLWKLSLQTLALMLLSTFLSTVIGIPVGIFISYRPRLRSIILPFLDAMQTMPSFVYLIPALMLFGLGKVPAIFATVIYAVCPLVRLTDLGIRQVSAETMEAARSFGASRLQLLSGVQLPLALPTIMAGINQTTMLALSMVVVASMIGARGLGEEVLIGIQKLNVGRGLSAGIAIVSLVVVIDRISQSIGRRLDKTR